jgi:TfoX/Sxy family transcriptional regulator of competence genes
MLTSLRVGGITSRRLFGSLWKANMVWALAERLVLALKIDGIVQEKIEAAQNRFNRASAAACPEMIAPSIEELQQ